jgi:hypothetical protein
MIFGCAYAKPVVFTSAVSATYFNESTAPKIDLLGVAVDLCHDPGCANCVNNIISGPDQCMILTGDWSDGLSSIDFHGDMKCWLYVNDNCKWPNIMLSQPSPALVYENFNDWTKSYKCERYSKRIFTFGMTKSPLAFSVEPFRTSPADRINRDDNPGNATFHTGVRVDYCKDPEFETCSRNILSDANKCMTLVGDWANGMSSINFTGQMNCTLFANKDCTGQSIQIYKASPNLGDQGFDAMTNAYSCNPYS